MADEVFRQRKPVTREEFQRQAPEPVEAFEAAAPAPVAEQPPAPPTRPVFQQEQPAFQIGNMHNAPAAFKSRLQNTNTGEEDSNFELAESRMKRRPAARAEAAPQLRATGSAKLEDLLEGIKEITTKYERVQLPSLGKFYNGDDGPTDGVIHIRPMTGEEEEILATSRFVKRGTAVNMIFNRCMREGKQYDSANFLSADRTFLLIWLRGISYTPDYDVEVTCPFTDKKFNHTINLDLDVETCPDDYDAQKLQGYLPETGYSYKFRLATGADEQRIQDYREKKSKFDTAVQADDTLLYRTALLVEEIEGLTDKRELQILLRKMPIADVGHLRNVTSEPPFGANTKITITSPFTMEDFEIDLPLEASFFFPRQKKVATQA